jgi:hypothetical protein
LPPYASIRKIANTVYKNKVEKVGIGIPDGEIVELRLDIPSYTEPQNKSKTPVWIPTIHSKGRGETLSHQHSAVINNVTMHLPIKGCLNIATGKTNKAPIATIRGTWEQLSPKEARAQAQQAMQDDNWIQVGMDPKRHSFFYDRKTQRPVIGGERAIQVGGLVLVKTPTYDDKTDYPYEEGLKELFKNLDEEIVNELTFHGRQCTDQCQGHKAGYEWETRKGLNVRQQTPSNSFNNGTEIATNKRNPTTGYVPPSSVKGEKGRFVKYAGPERFPDKFKQPVSQPQPPPVPPVQ